VTIHGSDDAPFQRIGIGGLGLMGGSVAMAVRRAWPSVSLVGCDLTPSTRAREVVDDVVERVADLAGCDLVLLAVPTGQLPDSFEQLVGAGSRAVVTDIGSTKRGVMAAAASAGLVSFVGGHPMAGAERSGLAFARADLFQDRPWLLVPGSGDARARTTIERFVIGLGARVEWMDAITHDRTVAYVSHLPQILAAALMNAAERAVGNSGPAVAGHAFAEMTRLASSPPAMWSGVLAENADFVSEALAALGDQLPRSGGRALAEWANRALVESGEARERWRQKPQDGQSRR
jgi:prephenate dehydrogenase